jgi:hypothetical protein
MRLFKTIVGAACALLATPSLASALVRVDVDLSSQTMHVATGDGEQYDWPISSGRAGFLTPRGRFRPMRLYPIVYSAKYHNTPMPLTGDQRIPAHFVNVATMPRRESAVAF